MCAASNYMAYPQSPCVLVIKDSVLWCAHVQVCLTSSIGCIGLYMLFVWWLKRSDLIVIH